MVDFLTLYLKNHFFNFLNILQNYSNTNSDNDK